MLDQLERAAIGRATAALNVALGENTFGRPKPGIILTQICRALMLARGNEREALNILNASRHERAAEVVQKAIGAGGLGSNWGATLAGHDEIQSFGQALSANGVFDAMFGDMHQIPPDTKFAVNASTVGSAAEVGDGAAAPQTKLSIASTGLTPVQIVALLGVTEELLRLASPGTLDFLNAVLQQLVIAGTDSSFFSTLIAHATAASNIVVSSGTSASAINADITALGAKLRKGATSKLRLVIPGDRLFNAAFKSTTTGALTFPDLKYNGGEIQGIPCLPTDSLAGSIVGSPLTLKDRVLLVDADALIAFAGDIGLAASINATLSMDSAPTMSATVTGSPQNPVATAGTSMFQTDAVALRALRYFGAAPIRNACVVLTGCNW